MDPLPLPHLLRLVVEGQGYSNATGVVHDAPGIADISHNQLGALNDRYQGGGASNIGLLLGNKSLHIHIEGISLEFTYRPLGLLHQLVVGGHNLVRDEFTKVNTSIFDIALGFVARRRRIASAILCIVIVVIEERLLGGSHVATCPHRRVQLGGVNIGNGGLCGLLLDGTAVRRGAVLLPQAILAGQSCGRGFRVLLVPVLAALLAS